MDRARIVLFSVSGQFHDLVKRRKNRHVDVEWAPEERLVAPSPWATLGVHVVVSPGSHAAWKGAG